MVHKHSKEYMNIYYRRTHEKRLVEQKYRRDKHREIINRAKMRPCADCGIQYSPWIMEFDHRMGTNKRWTIGSQVCRPIKDILQEIDKCDIVCSNCHAERTHRQRLLNPSGRKRASDLTEEECNNAVWINPKTNANGKMARA